MKAGISITLLALASVACALTFQQPTPVAVEVSTATQAATTEAPATATDSFSPTPAPTDASQPFRPFSATPWADNVLLRSNPGYLFPKLGVLSQGTELRVLGHAPGNEWLVVQTTDGRSGWVFAKLIDLGGHDPAESPTIQPSGVQIVVGRVKDELQQPISGIQFALLQGSGSLAPRNDAVTDETGTFYAFMPADAAGSWLVSYTAVACTSNTMDPNCNCVNNHCGMPDPQRVDIVLPRPGDEILEFVWK